MLLPWLFVFGGILAGLVLGNLWVVPHDVFRPTCRIFAAVLVSVSLWAGISWGIVPLVGGDTSTATYAFGVTSYTVVFMIQFTYAAWFPYRRWWKTGSR